MKASDRETMSAATASLPALDPNAHLSRLFAEHYRRVLIAAHRITGNMADAEDVAQSVFLRLGTADQAAVSNTGSYLYRAAVNGALDLLRRKKIVPIEPLESAAAEILADRAASPESQLANRELGQRLRQAVSELTPRAAEMFALRYLEDLSNGDIAKLMGTSQAVVAVTLYQSRSKLKKRLAELDRGMK
jgi:RNA polymerase sigma factor (sigma-70 family)